MAPVLGGKALLLRSGRLLNPVCSWTVLSGKHFGRGYLGKTLWPCSCIPPVLGGKTSRRVLVVSWFARGAPGGLRGSAGVSWWPLGGFVVLG